jgi:hypothetical protein
MHDELFKLQDLQYKDFHAKPLKSDEHSLFLTHLPHHYYDENQLHAFMISETKDYHEATIQAKIFLPYVNNWTTCNQLNIKTFKKHKNELLPYIKEWLNSNFAFPLLVLCAIL